MFFDKSVVLTIIFIITVAYTAPYLTQNDNLSDQYLVNEVKYISKQIGPRPAGSENEKKVAEYLALKFHDAGISTQIQTFEYRTLNSSFIKVSENVGTINGTSKKQIIICADLDTFNDKIGQNYSEGANDDATSLVALITLAKHYSKKPPYYTIKLIGFGAGEDEYSFPINQTPRAFLSDEQHNKIENIPYLIGARQYLLENQESLNDTLSVISLEAIGIGDPYFINQDSYNQNDPLFINFLVMNTRNKWLTAHKIDFVTYNTPHNEYPISHIYLPFSYAKISSTFLICMKTPNTTSDIQKSDTIPEYLTTNDTYENLVKNNKNEKMLQKHLELVTDVIKVNIDNIFTFYMLKYSLNANKSVLNHHFRYINQ